MPTIFDSKLAVFEKSRRPSVSAFDELQEAFMRLGPKNQRKNIDQIREMAHDTGAKKYDDLADLLDNVVKPDCPAQRAPRRRTVVRRSGGK